LMFLAATMFFACEQEEEALPLGDVEAWTGPTLTFTKTSGANPEDEANQDRITDRVWITRGNNGGQIFNAAAESNSEKDTSPEGTLWAVGTTDDLQNLQFDTFRNTIRPQSVVGQNLVLLLTEERIAIDVRFTSWARSRNGGFSYERSTSAP
jgi:hypothetical protein